MDEQVSAVEVPSVISIAFDPVGLPPGAVDADDFAQFLDGLQQTLDGVMTFDFTSHTFGDKPNQPKLVIVQIRESSVLCDTIIINLNILSNNAITISIASTAYIALAKAAIAYEAADVITSILKEAIRQGIADGVSEEVKELTQNGLKSAISGANAATSRLLHILKTATMPSASEGNDDLPPKLLFRILPGLRKMARVGAKRTYNNANGIAVSSTDPDEAPIMFSAEAQRHIERRAKRALEWSEPIEVVGAIEDPSRRKHRFVLDVPQTLNGERYIPCRYEPQLEDEIRELYRRRSYVKVRGEQRIRLYGTSTIPRTIIQVSSLEPAQPDDLWRTPPAS